MNTLDRLRRAVRPVDSSVLRQTTRRFDHKTKPIGSLGRLESLAAHYAAARGSAEPEPPRPALVVMAGDHGVAAEGVSAFPQAVTVQMLRNFARGGAAINVLARQAGARLVVVDMGTHASAVPQGVLDRRIGQGTRSFCRGPAMSAEQTARGVLAGAEVAQELAASGVTLLAVGEMGIGNTTVATALTAAYCDHSPGEITGYGTGVTEAQRAHKVAVVQHALAQHAACLSDPLSTLAALGGFEIAGLAGCVMGAASRQVPVVLDGFVATCAALAAVRLCPAVQPYLIAAHRSPEPGHAVLLATLGLEPLLDLGMRLGEGSGAALALPIVASAVALLSDMATFEAAGVSQRGAD